jgi:PTS system galactitol-specific IIC component
MARGNLFRSVVSGAVIMSIVLYICTSFGSSLTSMATSIGYEIPAGAVDITAMSAGNWVTWVTYQIGRLSQAPVLMYALMLVVIAVLVFLAYRYVGSVREEAKAVEEPARP